MYLSGSAFRTSVPFRQSLYLTNDRLDAASMILIEKLNKLEAKIAEQGVALGKIQEATSSLDPGFPVGGKTQLPFYPVQLVVSTEGFQLPKDRWASVDYFMSLPFISKLFPTGWKYESLFVDNFETPKDRKLPNLEKGHVQRLVDSYMSGIHPLHPIMKVAEIERIQKELDENGLSWNGETAIIMQILALGALLAGLESMDYSYAAKRRMGFAIEENNVMAVQTHYLQGYVQFRPY